jgi:flagellar hook-associated protein FlgK
MQGISTILNIAKRAHRLTKEIASLKGRILAIDSSQIMANDLQDQRNHLLEESSDWVNITYLDDSNGIITIQTSKGRLLVSGVHIGT